ncbi:MAG: TonB-dependent receptor [Microscillaceae bacterium]|nr:TonB-dependent receptor [Microscillaceae bacterium]MDW8459617.1 TonB-dependent receptor [Cytophagales bacterium]
MKHKTTFNFFCGFLVFYTLACAQDTTYWYIPSVEEVLKQERQTDEEIKVTTASRLKENLSDAPASITVITREDIERHGYRNLAELLARVPEVYTHFTGNNFDTDFRGFFTNNTRRNVLFLYNGHRLNERFHFGDFYADVIGDLNNVERVEIIRGPGGALYGSVAVQGVVNIITKNAEPRFENSEQKVRLFQSVVVEELGRNSLVQRNTFGFVMRFSKNTNLSINAYQVSGGLLFDTKTGNTVRPWQSQFTRQDGAGMARMQMRNQLYTYVPNDGSFRGGITFPSFDVRLNTRYFSAGAFMHSRAVTWVHPKENHTFNYPSNDRQWSFGAAYAELKPITKMQISGRISYNLSTNREISDMSSNDFFPNTTLSLAQNAYRNFYTGAGNLNRYLRRGEDFVQYVPSLDLSKFADSTLNRNGGGLNSNYAGVTKSFGAEFQLLPYQNEKITITAGGNLEIADYKNIQWVSTRQGQYIAHRPSGGITDYGWYYGLWVQAIYTPFPKLTLTAGLRYDYQMIENVYRNIANEVIYTFNAQTNVFTPFQVRNKFDENFTPRFALNYRFSENTNIRLIYAQAFRAVPPQEVIRLPFGTPARSEITRNYELIVKQYFAKKRGSITFNAFHLENNRLYQFNPATQSFNAGSAWRNTGITLAAQHQLLDNKLLIWANGSYFFIRRPSDAFAFMRDWKNPRPGTGIVGTIGSGGVAPIYDPLPNQYLPLDSPQHLFKAGISYAASKGFTIGIEQYWNGEIQTLAPANNNVGDLNPAILIVQGNQVIENTQLNPNNYTIHRVPASQYFNLYLRQSGRMVGIKNIFVELKVNNLFNTTVWNVLNADAQSWNSNLYYKPNQIPDFGRRYLVSLNYSF